MELKQKYRIKKDEKGFLKVFLEKIINNVIREKINIRNLLKDCLRTSMVTCKK